MASNSFGELLRITTFGESHGPALGVVIDGVPAGLPLTVEEFLPELARRRPGQSTLTSARQESDTPRLLSGLFEGRTTGMPITVVVDNHDARPADYDALRAAPRAGHADATYASKYGHRDHRGGGRSSGRETVARVIGGVVARKLLPQTTRILAHTTQIGPHVARDFDFAFIEQNPLRCADRAVAPAMAAYVAQLKEQHDSTGGRVEIRVEQPPIDLGDPAFSKLKSKLAEAILSVGAVTGFSYGAGFRCAALRGSEYVADAANFGGMLGGISNGETIVLEASIKPTSTIGAAAKAGRHDPCVVPRVIPVLEAMVALVLADRLLMQRALAGHGAPRLP